MSLTRYKEKRHFPDTPEPTGGKGGAQKLLFVIQKHAASHLHYDFRLEMAGVLKSWAVPKGPSTDPEIKRLAMMVEDHPFDYRNFEGIIPKGNYGAGTVIVWDEGTYESAEPVTGNKKAQEKNLLYQLHSGKLKIILHGKKLKGEYALVKSSARRENAWLLMKLKDANTSPKDITLKDKSVQSGKNLEHVKSTSNHIYGQVQKSVPGPADTVRKANNKSKLNTEKNNPVKLVKSASTNKTEVIKHPALKGTKASMPKTIAPMLATLVDKPFNVSGWLYEVKWDGYRAIGKLNGNKVELLSRNNKSFNEKFYPVREALKSLNQKAVVDGEIVVVNEKGIADFSALQNWRSEADGQLIYYLFDLLWLDGRDLRKLPLVERKKILRQLIPQDDAVIRFSENFESDGIRFFEMAKKMGLEGIIAKKEDSPYLEGIRAQSWLKIKTAQRQEVVIGGYTKNDDTPKVFSSLLVGVFENGKLHYTGKIGTGFTGKLQKELMEQFKKIQVKKCPFTETPDINKPSRFRLDPPHASAVWLKPKMIAEVTYRELTPDGVMRHPSFEGLREDKNAKEVIQEKPVVLASDHPKMSKMIVPPRLKDRKTLLNPTEETQVRKVGVHELKFTNLNKIYWPVKKVTKRDMLNYYYQISPFILPYLKDRPQTLNRFPNGINGKAFYQKDVTGKVPDWISTFLYHSGAEERDKHFLVCTDEASLLYIANLAAIEINPWSSRIQSPDQPDWCVIDLDPDKNTFNQVIETAQITKKILDAIDLPSYCKTSGSTGIHIYIPLGAKYSYEESKEFGRIIAKLVHRETNKFTSIERATAKRDRKMYIDFLQNRPQATLAAPYSLRPKPGATVSMPLHWEEIKPGLNMQDFTIFNAVGRVRREGDLFKPVIGKGINLEKALKKIDTVFK